MHCFFSSPSSWFSLLLLTETPSRFVGLCFFSLSGSLEANFSICGFGSINVQNQGQTEEKATEGHWLGHQMVSWMLVGEHESRKTWVFPTVYWVKVSMDMLLWIYDVLWGVWVSSVIKTLAYGDSGLVPIHLRLKRAQQHFLKVSLLMSPRIKATFWLKACFHHIFGKGLPSSIPPGWSTRVLFCLLFWRTHFGRDEGYCRPFCFNFKIWQSDPRRQLQPMKAIH